MFASICWALILQLCVGRAYGQDLVGQNMSACPLPEGGRWCGVHATEDHPAFEMAVNAYDRTIGGRICRKGYWDPIPLQKIERRLPPTARVMLDIGANIGWYSLLFASRGWQVEAFEGMPRNAALLEATLCRYPSLRERVHVHRTALGPIDRREPCGVYSPKGNPTDGVVCCPGECGGSQNAHDNPNYILQGHITMRSLDEMMESEVKLAPQTVGYVKIDVEGYECGIIQGAKQLLSTARPFLIKSEVNTWHKNACPPKEYLQMFMRAGYAVHTTDFDGKLYNVSGPDIKLNTNDDYFMRLSDKQHLRVQVAPAAGPWYPSRFVMFGPLAGVSLLAFRRSCRAAAAGSSPD